MIRTDQEGASGGRSIPAWVAGVDFLVCAAAFSLALWLYGALVGRDYFASWSAETIREVIVSSVIAWSAVASSGIAWGNGIRLWVDRLFSAVGFNLVIQYGLVYVFHIRPTPWPVAVAGAILAVGLIAALRKLAFRNRSERSIPTLLLGYDGVAESLLPALGRRVVGILDEHPERIPSYGRSPSAPPVLGDFSRFDEVVAGERPGRLVVNTPDGFARVLPRRLLDLRYAGVMVEDASTLFESALKRVCWERRDPLDLLLSPDLKINRPAIALQAIYTNVIGLVLLVLLSPVILMIALLVTLTTAGLPLESSECLGFHRIPFRPLRFCTRRRDGKLVWFGSLLKKLHMVNLPQLINVVRGEMALFGPPPARKEFAERLSELVPVYAHRFIVKPGMMGWSQANLPEGPIPPDESLRLEYDLYYIREESPSLDLDILFRTIFRSPFQPGDAIQ